MKAYLGIMPPIALVIFIIVAFNSSCGVLKPRPVAVEATFIEEGGVTCEGYAKNFSEEQRLSNIQTQLLMATEAYHDGRMIPIDLNIHIQSCLTNKAKHRTLDAFVRVKCANPNVLSLQSGNERFQTIFGWGQDHVLQNCKVIRP